MRTALKGLVNAIGTLFLCAFGLYFLSMIISMGASVPLLASLSPWGERLMRMTTHIVGVWGFWVIGILVVPVALGGIGMVFIRCAEALEGVTKVKPQSPS